MAEYLPPTDNVPIFDVTNFAISGSGLTEAQIASKFLRFPTGQGTETLPALITGTITAPNTMDIVMPNALASNVLNVGVVSRNISGQIHHYSDGDNCVAGAGVHLNNGINNASNTNIMNGTTTTGICNIMSGASSTGTTNIGATTSTLALKGTTSILGATSINTTGGLNTNIGTSNSGSVNLKAQTITIAESTTVNIQTTNPSDNTKSTTIGAVNGPFTTLTTINGRLTTAGVTNINTTGTSGTNIGASGSTTTIVGPTNINTSGTTNTTIGVSGSTTAILGTTNINTSGTANTTIGNNTGGTTTLASDTINIGNIDTLMYIEGSSINIQNIASSTLNLMTSASLGSVANIMTGASNTSTLTIGNTGTTIGINGVININTATPLDNLKTTTIGATNGVFDTNTNISGKTTINKLSLTAPITSAYTVVPTSSQLGFIPTAIFNAGDATLEPNNFTMTAFTNYSFAKIELTAGTWIITGSLRANSNASFGSVICAITPTQAVFDFATDYYVQSFNASFIDLNFLATRIVQVTATQFYFLTSRSSAASQVVNNYKFTATRTA